MTLTAPFPWFGGKSRAAHLIWAALGDVGTYCEPFAGSLATLLARPRVRGVETVNDLDGYLVNFWRAVRAVPAEVAKYAEGPASELDLGARHRWLVDTGRARIEALRTDPDFYDAKVAGWWVWGLCLWIGGGWCVSGGSQMPATPRGLTKAPLNHRVGIVSDSGPPRLQALSDRLRNVRILCGDWSRAVSSQSLVGNQHRSGGGRTGITGVLLDPPYPTGEDLYSVSATGVCREVWRWAEEHGDDPHLRIVVCGHEGDWTPPEGWQTVEWTARRSFASQKGSGQRERLWCSPACLSVVRPQAVLDFGGAP
ncbi:MAG TPA: DNA adenine methylase [Myxococcota bacterium]|nr:DNA adenine methylase [Myxococcota bacterium]